MKGTSEGKHRAFSLETPTQTLLHFLGGKDACLRVTPVLLNSPLSAWTLAANTLLRTEEARAGFPSRLKQSGGTTCSPSAQAGPSLRQARSAAAVLKCHSLANGFCLLSVWGAFLCSILMPGLKDLGGIQKWAEPGSVPLHALPPARSLPGRKARGPSSKSSKSLFNSSQHRTKCTQGWGDGASASPSCCMLFNPFYPWVQSSFEGMKSRWVCDRNRAGRFWPEGFAVGATFGCIQSNLLACCSFLSPQQPRSHQPSPPPPPPQLPPGLSLNCPSCPCTPPSPSLQMHPPLSPPTTSPQQCPTNTSLPKLPPQPGSSS